MINETKRDVLADAVDALADAQASGGNIGHQDANLFMAKYEKALPDDLPVIPKAISEYIKNLRKYHRDLVDVFGMVRDLGITRTEPTGVLVWVTNNIDTFAHAWLLGVWRVEETGEIVKLEAEK
ncbi:hypothetical protein ABC653_07605 [Lacticaseibacillus paracasei]|uniref:hypothetical protein n=1 Tax=Lacticaseibacillus paracasei TaxID=1597 RepID=UPI0031E1BD7D